MNTLSVTDAAYFAGIVDGEGTITLSRLHRSENRRVVVSVSSTERILLEYLQRAVCAGTITTKKTAAPQHAPGYAWSVRGRQAIALLSQIAPYLRTYKARRARLLLEHYVRLTPRNGKYRPEQLEERRQFETRLLSLTARRQVRNRVRPRPLSRHERR